VATNEIPQNTTAMNAAKRGENMRGHDTAALTGVT
jgi:hypothetical protein